MRTRSALRLKQLPTMPKRCDERMSSTSFEDTECARCFAEMLLFVHVLGRAGPKCCDMVAQPLHEAMKLRFCGAQKVAGEGRSDGVCSFSKQHSITRKCPKRCERQSTIDSRH